MALKILLADDSMTAQNMGKKILTDAGYEVLTVSNGAAAVKKLAEVTPDIAVLDVYMPGYSGLEVCERMKTMPATARIPVLLTVGKMEPFRPEDGMKAKADGVIIKPFEATDLVTVVEKLALRVYGFTPAKASGDSQAHPSTEQHDGKVQEDAAARHASAEEKPAPVPQCIVDEDSEPVFSAAGLQTFAPLDDEVPEVAPEPHIEFTHAPQVEVAAEGIVGLEPTVLQDDILAQNATEDTLVGFGGIGQQDTGTKPGLGEGAFAAYDALSSTVPEPEPVWEAVAEPADVVDLEAEMRRAQAVAQQPGAAHTEEDVAPRMMAASAGVGATAEPGVPLLAPIGKTSMDEFDALMAETAARFEASSASVVEEKVPARAEVESVAEIATAPEPITELELEPSREEMAALAEPAVDFSMHDNGFEPTIGQPDVRVAEDDGLLSELISEEREEPVFTPMPPTMRGSDALSGVFDLDAPQVAEAPAPAAEMGTACEAELAEAVEEQRPAELQVPTQLAAEEEEPVWATIVPERVSKDLLLHQATGPADTAVDVQTANGAVAEEVDTRTVTATGGQQGIALDEATMNTLVERVVDRVLERLKPILVVTVEEILREFKR